MAEQLFTGESVTVRRSNILVIIPALNEEACIAQVVRAVRKACPADVLVIDDASTDATAGYARSAGADVLSLPVNLGIGGAVQTGLLYADEHGYDIAVQIDGDGQHDPLYLDVLTQPLIRGVADMVIGSRFIERKGYQSTMARRGGIAVLRLLFRLLIRRRITDCTSGFRAYNRAAIAFLKDRYPADYPEPESILMLSRHGFRVQEIPVTMLARAGGRSSIGGWAAPFYVTKVALAIIMEAMRDKQ